MKKETKKVFGKTYYLLGKKDGEKVWLEEGHFDCDWYWGIGYVETFNKRYTDINMHTHFDTLFFNGNKCCYDLFNEYFDETTLDKDEIWKVLEYMKSIYTMREYSDLLHIGGAHITTNAFKDDIKNDDEYERINKKIIPMLLNEVYKIIGESEVL